MVLAGVWLGLLAPGWPQPPAEMLAGRRLVPGEVLWGISSSGWAGSFLKACECLQALVNICLGPKDMLRRGHLLSERGNPFWRVTPGDLVTSAVLG